MAAARVSTFRCKPLLQPPSRSAKTLPPCGGMAEWLKAHDWKSCSPKGVRGSNPRPSATHIFHLIDIIEENRRIDFICPTYFPSDCLQTSLSDHFWQFMRFTELNRSDRIATIPCHPQNSARLKINSTCFSFDLGVAQALVKLPLKPYPSNLQHNVHEVGRGLFLNVH